MGFEAHSHFAVLAIATLLLIQLMVVVRPSHAHAQTTAITCTTTPEVPEVFPPSVPNGVTSVGAISCTGSVYRIHVWVSQWICYKNCPATRYKLSGAYTDPDAQNTDLAYIGTADPNCNPGGTYYTRAGGFAYNSSGTHYPLSGSGSYSKGVHTNCTK